MTRFQALPCGASNKSMLHSHHQRASHQRDPVLSYVRLTGDGPVNSGVGPLCLKESCMSQRNWQTTLRILLLAAVVILIVSLSNCARKKSGIYVAKDLHPAPFIELKSDGTFYVQRATGGGVSGTYEVDGDTERKMS